jgi:hypothetical protein
LKRAGGAKLRECINFLIKILEEHQVPATWAIVGHLAIDPSNKCIQQGNLLWGHESRLTKPHVFDVCAHTYDNSLLYLEKDIFEKILLSGAGHEIGYHSFSHAIFSRISKKAADLEMRAGVEVANQLKISFKSFIFPQNEIGHIDLLKRYGFLIYRGETLRYCENRAHMLNKFNGMIDEIVAPPLMPEWKDGIWELPSSMQFCDPKYPFTLFPRAKLGLWRAMRSNMVFHIWMHPWDLLRYGALSQDFERFIVYVSKKRNEGKIEVMTMQDFATYLNETY